MSKVILLIDGTEVYNNSTSSSTSTTPNVEYTPVKNPKIGNNYYYMPFEYKFLIDKHSLLMSQSIQMSPYTVSVARLAMVT
jgi:hypothetical protein